MFFRAIMMIGLVWLLWPHEPDLGLGRPPTPFQSGNLKTLRDGVIDRIDDVRTELESAQSRR